MKPFIEQKGFTLIEVVVAIAILTIGILSLYSMQISAIRGNSLANHLTTAATWNTDRLERFLNLAITDAAFTDTDNDGTNQDSDGNGIDEVGSDHDFGLNDTIDTSTNPSTITADKNEVQGQYTIYWNVAEGVPAPNLKTIRVLVQDTATFLARPIAYTYIKRQ